MKMWQKLGWWLYSVTICSSLVAVYFIGMWLDTFLATDAQLAHHQHLAGHPCAQWMFSNLWNSNRNLWPLTKILVLPWAALIIVMSVTVMRRGSAVEVTPRHWLGVLGAACGSLAAGFAMLFVLTLNHFPIISLWIDEENRLTPLQLAVQRVFWVSVVACGLALVGAIVKTIRMPTKQSSVPVTRGTPPAGAGAAPESPAR